MTILVIARWNPCRWCHADISIDNIKRNQLLVGGGGGGGGYKMGGDGTRPFRMS